MYLARDNDANAAVKRRRLRNGRIEVLTPRGWKVLAGKGKPEKG